MEKKVTQYEVKDNNTEVPSDPAPLENTKKAEESTLAADLDQLLSDMFCKLELLEQKNNHINECLKVGVDIINAIKPIAADMKNAHELKKKRAQEKKETERQKHLKEREKREDELKKKKAMLHRQKEIKRNKIEAAKKKREEADKRKKLFQEAKKKKREDIKKRKELEKKKLLEVKKRKEENAKKLKLKKKKENEEKKSRIKTQHGRKLGFIRSSNKNNQLRKSSNKGSPTNFIGNNRNAKSPNGSLQRTNKSLNRREKNHFKTNTTNISPKYPDKNGKKTEEKKPRFGRGTSSSRQKNSRSATTKSHRNKYGNVAPDRSKVRKLSHNKPLMKKENTKGINKVESVKKPQEKTKADHNEQAKDIPKEQTKEETQEQNKIKPKEESKKEAKQQTKEEINKEINEDVKDDIKKDVTEGIKEEINQDVNEEDNNNIKEAITEVLKEEIKLNNKADVKEVVEEEIQEVKKDIKEDPKVEAKDQTKEVLKEETNPNSNEEIKKDTKEDPKVEAKDQTKEVLKEETNEGIKEKPKDNKEVEETNNQETIESSEPIENQVPESQDDELKTTEIVNNVELQTPEIKTPIDQQTKDEIIDPLDNKTPGQTATTNKENAVKFPEAKQGNKGTAQEENKEEGMKDATDNDYKNFESGIKQLKGGFANPESEKDISDYNSFEIVAASNRKTGNPESQQSVTDVIETMSCGKTKPILDDSKVSGNRTLDEINKLIDCGTEKAEIIQGNFSSFKENTLDRAVIMDQNEDSTISIGNIQGNILDGLDIMKKEKQSMEIPEEQDPETKQKIQAIEKENEKLLRNFKKSIEKGFNPFKATEEKKVLDFEKLIQKYEIVEDLKGKSSEELESVKHLFNIIMLVFTGATPSEEALFAETFAFLETSWSTLKQKLGDTIENLSLTIPVKMEIQGIINNNRDSFKMEQLSKINNNLFFISSILILYFHHIGMIYSNKMPFQTNYNNWGNIYYYNQSKIDFYKNKGGKGSNNDFLEEINEIVEVEVKKPENGTGIAKNGEEIQEEQTEETANENEEKEIIDVTDQTVKPDQPEN